MDPGGPKPHFKRGIGSKTGVEKDGLGLTKNCRISGKLILHTGLPPGGPEASVALFVARKLFWPSGKSAIIAVDDTGSHGPNMAVNSPLCGTSRAQTP